MKSRLVNMTVAVHRRTEKAVLVSDNGDPKHAAWLPLSAIEITDEVDEGLVKITLPERLALEKGLI